jgi:hypothetical protein
MTIKNIHIIFLFFLTNTLCLAQEDSIVVEKDTFDNYRLHKLWELGVSANAYKGDLSDNYGFWSSSMHLGLKFAKKKRWNGHFNFSIGNIRGENYAYEFSNTATPNRFFRTNLVAFQFDLQYNFLKTKHWIGHVGQGIGLMRFLPKNENNVKLQNELQTRAINEVYGNVTAILPTSVAITYLLKNGYGLGMNVTWLRPTTDYLDNISLWGTKQGNDKVIMVKFYVSVPAWKIRKFLRLEDNIKPTSR